MAPLASSAALLPSDPEGEGLGGVRGRVCRRVDHAPIRESGSDPVGAACSGGRRVLRRAGGERDGAACGTYHGARNSRRSKLKACGLCGHRARPSGGGRTGCVKSAQAGKVNVSQVFAGQNVGGKQVDEHVWLVTFMDTTWAILTMRRAGSDRSTIRLIGVCYPCLRNRPSESGRGDWIRTSDPLRPRRKNPHNWGQLETAAPRFS